MTQGSDSSDLTRIEESYCVGDVLIASTAVIGNGVMLRADPGCSITIREGTCLGPGVLIHASAGSIELHPGVCLASGVLIFGAGKLGRQVCVGADSTLINPCFPEGTIISANSLWGDESRPVLQDFDCSSPNELDDLTKDQDPAANAANHKNVEEIPARVNNQDVGSPDAKASPSRPASSPSASTVIGRQQFEMMVLKMFPDRDAFKQSQT